MSANPSFRTPPLELRKESAHEKWNAADFFDPKEWNMSFKEDWERFLTQQRRKHVLSQKPLGKVSNLKMH